MKRGAFKFVVDPRKMTNIGHWILEKYTSEFTVKVMMSFAGIGAVLGGWQGGHISYGSLQRHKEDTFEGVMVGAAIGLFAGGTWPISIPLWVTYKVLEVSTRQ